MALASPPLHQDIRSSRKVRDDVRKWLQKGKSMKILVAGKMGVGKSSLINGIVGVYIAKEGDDLQAVTTMVKEYRRNVRGVKISIIDTPGMADPARQDEKIADDIKKITSGKVDLMVVCIDMRSRVGQDDVNVMQTLTTALNPEVWQNSLIVLTFANNVQVPRAKTESEKRPTLEEYFKNRLSEFETKLHQFLKERCNVDDAIADDVPVIPAGYDELSLPTQKDWLSFLWLQSLTRISPEAAPALLNTAEGRADSKPDRAHCKLPWYRKLNIFDSTAMDFVEMVAEAVSNAKSVIGKKLSSFIKR